MSESRNIRMKRERLLPTLLTLLTVILFSGSRVYLFLRWETVERPVAETDGVKQISSVVDGHLAVYDGTNWNTQFWNGVNLGATLPGHSPGDLAPSKKDYRRWFEQITDEGMNTDVLRVYSILPPHFYEALYESNSTRTRHAYGPGYQHGRFSGRILTLNVGGESRAVPATNQRERTV